MNINPKMTETNQSDRNSTDRVIPGVFWGTIALNGITLLVYAYIFNLLLQQTKTLGIYGAIMVVFLAILAGIVGIVFTIRQRQDLGLKLSLYPTLAIGIIIISIFQGRTLPASFSILVISVVANMWLLQRESRRTHLIATILALIVMWAIDWINPAWRISINAASVGPAGAIVFLVIFGLATIRRVWQGNLRTKLVSAFLIVTIVPLAIISYLNYRSTTNALVQAADVKIASAAQVTADAVDTFFNGNLNTIRVKAQDPVIVDYLLLPASQRAGSPEEAQVNKLLNAYSHEDSLFVNSIGVIDAQGKSLTDTSAAEVGVDKSDRVYFQQAIKTGLPYSSELIFSEVTGKASLYFTAPVRNPADGSIIGVFRIRYDAGILQTIVAKNAGLIGEASLPVLIDQDHIRLAHGVLPELDYKTIVPLSANVLAKLQADHRIPKGTAEQLSTNLPEFEAGLNNVAKQPFFIAELHEAGQGTEETTAVKLKSHPWTMVFGQTNTVFLAPIQAQTRNSLAVALVLAIAAAFVGLFIAQTMAGPVARLTAVAEQIAGGDIQVQAKVETSDEIGALAGTFNQMTAQLREFITTLEERVAARTKDLEIVAEVGTATATILESKQLLQEVVDLTKERFNLYHSHIYLLDEEGKNLVLTSGAGEPGRIMVTEGRSIPLDREQSLVARAARERKGVTVNDVTESPDFLPNPLLPDTRSELAVPMIVANKVIGVFDIQSEQVGRFTDSDVNIQTTMAAQLATSIQNVRSFEQSRKQAEFESLTNTIGQRIQRTTSIEDTLQTAIREIGLALGASRVSASIGNSRQNGDGGN